MNNVPASSSGSSSSSSSVLLELNLLNVVMDDHDPAAKSRRRHTLRTNTAVSSFRLEKAVCNHGSFMMAPNKWIPSSKTLQRPLHLAASSSSVLVSIYQPPLPQYSLVLHVRVHDVDSLSPADETAILNQVKRMLRLSKTEEDSINRFHQIHPRAKALGFGRLFRSPTLFEDIIKSILLCNCSWQRTLQMAQALCDVNKNKLGNFPTCRELANIFFSSKSGNGISCSREDDHKELRRVLGYRAKHIENIVRMIDQLQLLPPQKNGTTADHSDHELEKLLLPRLEQVKGVGPFVVANVSMFLGFYDTVPADTETVKHFQKVHGLVDCNKKNVNACIKQFYQKFSPFQSLAYWLEHVEYYEKLFGKLSLLPSSDYALVTSSLCSSAAQRNATNKYNQTREDDRQEGKRSRSKVAAKTSSNNKKKANSKKRKSPAGWASKFKRRRT